ncbi:MAG: T9SS type A sorting domain-containing protein [Ignavibacteriae bacterium]|nr:T9SS type A sorting domain-containing protein [Ignavibacteriota bacterium]
MKKLTISLFVLVFSVLYLLNLHGQEKKPAIFKTKSECEILNYINEGEKLSPPAKYSSTIQSAQTGQWDQTSTWIGGIIPSSSDNVEIKPGHTVYIDTTNQQCKDLDIASTGSIVINPNIRFYIYGNILNNGTINGTASGCHLQFCGSASSQIFTNKGTVTVPLQSLSVNNPNGLSISSTTGQIKVLRVNLFWGTITGSSIITIGNGGTTYGTVQRGAQGSTFPAGSFDVSPVFNVGSGGLNLLYTISSTAIDMGFEVPSLSGGNPAVGNVNYIFTNFVTNMTGSVTVIDSINLAATTFSVGANTLTLNKKINYYGGILSGGTTSNLTVNGTNPLSVSVFDGLNNFTVNNSGGVTLDTSLTVYGTLTLTSGQLTNRSYLSMGNSATISRAQGYLSSSPIFGTYINLVYTGSSGITMGYEVPVSSTVLRNLTVNNTSGVTQIQTPGPVTEVFAMQSFENSTFPPTGWVNTRISGNKDWVRYSGDYLVPGGANSTTYNALLYNNIKGTKTDLITPAFDCSNASGATLTFYHKQAAWSIDQDSLALYVSSDGGTCWTRIYTYQSSVTTWSFRSWNLANYVSLTNNMKIKFRGCAEYGYGIGIDEVYITKTGVSTPSTVTVNGTFTLTNSSYSIGNNTLVLNSSIVKSGTNFITGGASSNLRIGGSTSGSTLPPVNNGLYNFTVNRSNGITLGGPVNTTTLTLTSGKVTSSSVNLLTVTGTTTSSVSVSNGWVNGPLAITLPASLSSGYTYRIPVGKSTSNRLELIYPTTTTGGSVVVKAEVFDSKTNGSCGNQIATLDSTRYWTLNIISGASNFLNTRIRLTQSGLTNAKAVAISTEGLTGTYHYLGRWVSGSTIRTQNFIGLSTSYYYLTTGTADNNYGTGSTYSGNLCFANSLITGVSHPVFEWYDPVVLGHTLISDGQWTGGGDDGYFRIPDIGFNFSFCGNTYRTNNVYIGSNGYLTFGSGSSSLSYSDMFPSTSVNPANTIAACLRDLDCRSALYSDCKVYYGGDNSTYFAVTFVRSHAYNQINDYITFQIIIFYNGNYRFQYKADEYLHGGSVDIENSCSVGWQNLDRTKGVQYRYNGIGGPLFSSASNLLSNLALEFGNNLGSLPVELASFSYQVSGRDVKLNWETAKEQNNAGFEIFRKSSDEDIWLKTGFVKGNGTINTQSVYLYYDKNLKSGKYSYKIKQMDYNGNFREYELGNEVSIGIPSKYSLSQNYPNPFNSETRIHFEICKLSSVVLKIYDVTGREIKTLIEEKLKPDYYDVKWNATNYSSGVFFITLKAGDFFETKKMVLIK